MQLSFSTSAQLAAFAFKPRHVGADVYDREAGLAYVCVTAGTGLAALSELTGSGGGGAPDPHATSHEDGGGDDIDVTTLAGYPGGTTDFLRADGSFAAPPGGITATVWDPRVTPAGLHASSDAFTADTIGGGSWLDWDHGGIYSATIDTARRRMRLQGTGNGTNTRGGVYKAVPSNSFAVACRVAFQGTLDNANQVPTIGMSFLQDGASSTGDWLGLEVEKRGTSNSWPIEWHVATAYNNLGSSASKDLFGNVTSLWLCAIVTIVPATSTTVLGHYSTDGEYFVRVANFNSAYAAQHMGLQLGVLGSGTTKYAYVSDYRVYDGLSDIEDLENGGLIS